MRTVTSLLAMVAITIASGHLACGGSSGGGQGASTGSTGTSSGSGSGGGTSTTGSTSASGSSSGGGAGTCFPSGVFQCPPPSAGCLGVDAGGQPFLMCNLGEICITTDGCDLTEQGTGCVAAPATPQCSCAAAEAALANMGCPPSWVANTDNAGDKPATGCTVDCN